MRSHTLAAIAAASFASLALAQGWNHNAYCGGVFHSTITNSFVNKVVAGSGNELFVAGLFNRANGTTVANVARFNGCTGSAMGAGIAATVTALARSTSGTVFAGDVNGVVYQFNGTSWSQVGTTFNAPITALVVQGSAVVAGGSFTSPVAGVARLVGGSWAALGSGFNTPTTVNSLDVDASGNIFAGGSLDPVGVGSTNLAVFNTTTWTTFSGGAAPSGTIDVVRLAPDGTLLTAHSSPFSVNRGSGTGWVALATSLAGGVVRDVLGLPTDEVVICGSFTSVNAVAAAGVARFDGSSWTALATTITAPVGVTPSINSMVIKNKNRIAMGGNFIIIGSAASRVIDRFPEVSASTSTVVSTGCNNFPQHNLVSNEVPLVGIPFDSSVSNLPATSLLVQVLGVSQVIPGVDLSTLPISGDPACTLDITLDVVLAATAHSGSPTTVSVVLNSSVLGFTIFQQVVIFDTTATPGLTRSTNAQSLTCGKL